jgi:arsenate reductase
MKKTVLFICSHNSGRSQIAEGLLNAYYGKKYKAYSAGIIPAKINPLVIQVMTEIGIDLSKNRSKSIEEFRGESFDIVVTVCDNAQEVCPFFPGKKVLHKNFQDPSLIQGSKEERVERIKQIRDNIMDWILETFYTPPQPSNNIE